MTTTTNREAKISEIQELNVYELARLADCAAPDNSESPGAAMLARVRDDALEALEDATLDDIDRINDDGAISEIADGAPSIYIYQKWMQFVDLAAWQEDISEYGEPGDMDKAGSIALYMIAERLCNALVDQVRDAMQEDADAEDEEEDDDE